MPEAKTVLVTGASGFIAKHICLKLLNAGYDVRGSLRSLARSREVVDAVKPYLTYDGDLDRRLTFVALDLANDAGWDEAMKGADILMHTASPFPLEQPKDADEVIRPAVDGTLRALKAARSAGVNRVVLTSSIAAITSRPLDAGRTQYDESDWTDPTDPATTPYVKSKTLAEQAAWDFVRDSEPEMALTVINPGFVLGPPLDTHFGTSLQVVQRVLRSQDPALPNFGFATVDVRDIAEMHVKALSRPESVGKRLIGADRFYWFVDMAKTLAAAYPERKITTRRAPNWLVKMLGLFDKSIRTIIPNLDRRQDVSNAQAKRILGIDFIDVEDSIRASADFLIGNDLVR